MTQEKNMTSGGIDGKGKAGHDRAGFDTLMVNQRASFMDECHTAANPAKVGFLYFVRTSILGASVHLFLDTQGCTAKHWDGRGLSWEFGHHYGWEAGLYRVSCITAAQTFIGSNMIHLSFCFAPNGRTCYLLVS